MEKEAEMDIYCFLPSCGYIDLHNITDDIMHSLSLIDGSEERTGVIQALTLDTFRAMGCSTLVCTKLSDMHA